MGVGDNSRPLLVGSGYTQVFRSDLDNRQLVVAVCGANPIFLSRPTKPTFFSHDPLDFLVIDTPALAFELLGHPAVSIPGRIQANFFHAIDQHSVRMPLLRLVDVSAFGKIHRLASPFNVFDEGAVVGNELTLF
jgi:hypothetical protein